MNLLSCSDLFISKFYGGKAAAKMSSQERTTPAVAREPESSGGSPLTTKADAC